MVIWINLFCQDIPSLEINLCKINLIAFFCNKYRLAQLGVLAPGSAHTQPSAQPPIDTSKKCRRMCLQSRLQTSPQAPQNSYMNFQNSGTTSGNPPPLSDQM